MFNPVELGPKRHGKFEEIEVDGSVSAASIDIADYGFVRAAAMQNGINRSFDLSAFTTAVAGTGAVSAKNTSVELSTAATAGSYARIVMGSSNAGWCAGTHATKIDWSKPGVLSLAVASFAETTNGQAWFFLGVNALALPTTADPGNTGVGIRIDNAAISGIVYGASLASVNLSTTIDEVVKKIDVAWDGAGNVSFFVDGVLKGSSSAGPTGESTSYYTQFCGWVTNGADSATQSLGLYLLRVVTGEI